MHSAAYYSEAEIILLIGVQHIWPMILLLALTNTRNVGTPKGGQRHGRRWQADDDFGG